MIKADQDVDQRYQFLRDKHGEVNPMANGYRLGSFFAREQRVVLSALDLEYGPFLDIACGSGLMLEPLVAAGKTVYGLDYNMQACVAAQQNGLQILRGDAFNMPLASGAVGQIVNCQFLNQQPPAETRQFIAECARVLKPGGQLIMLWRHAHSMVHITAHALFTMKDRLSGQPSFPQYVHPMKQIKKFADQAGLFVHKKYVTLPFLKPDYIAADNPAGFLFGASLFTVLRKP